jgi:hypothetical protein
MCVFNNNIYAILYIFTFFTKTYDFYARRRKFPVPACSGRAQARQVRFFVAPGGCAGDFVVIKYRGYE